MKIEGVIEKVVEEIAEEPEEYRMQDETNGIISCSFCSENKVRIKKIDDDVRN